MKRKHPTLFDAIASVEERDRALEQVADGQGPWFDTVLAFVKRFRRGWRGAGEDVRRLWLETDGEPPRHHNSWGALIKMAIAAGYLRKTGRRVRMRSVKANARETDEYERN